MRKSPSPELAKGYTHESISLLDAFSGYNNSGGMGDYNVTGGRGADDPFTYNISGGMGADDPFIYNPNGGRGAEDPYTYNKSGGRGAGDPSTYNNSGGRGAASTRGAFGWHGGRGTGYRADLPDHRDYDLEMLREKLSAGRNQALKERIDKYCSGQRPTQHSQINIGDGKLYLWPVADQGRIHSCTAQAVAGMLEYRMRQRDDDTSGRHIHLSRLFIYKRTRELLGLSGDVGASLRTAIQAVGDCGAPAERDWPYLVNRVEVDPDARAVQYAIRFAEVFAKLDYVRLDSNGAQGEETLNHVLHVLADKCPVVGGFPVYRSVGLMKKPKGKAGQNAKPDDYVIPPAHFYEYDTPVGGHAALIVGYDDDIVIKDPFDKKPPAEGALIIRNSWGRQWGDQGFAYLPYWYVTSGLACDFWTILSQNKFTEEPFQAVEQQPPSDGPIEVSKRSSEKKKQPKRRSKR